MQNFGLGLGDVLAIVDTTSDSTPIESSQQQTNQKTMSAAMSSGGSQTPVSIGKLEVDVSIQVSFGFC